MVKFSDIEDAFFYVSSDQPFMNEAIVNRKTGKTYYKSELSGNNDFPKDMNSQDYLDIPHKNDLDLGNNLVSDFTIEIIPEHSATIERIFRQRGAYRRFKDFLNSVGKLEAWYKFEDEKTKNALRQWCKDNNLEIIE